MRPLKEKKSSNLTNPVSPHANLGYMTPRYKSFLPQKKVDLPSDPTRRFTPSSSVSFIVRNAGPIDQPYSSPSMPHLLHFHIKEKTTQRRLCQVQSQGIDPSLFLLTRSSILMSTQMSKVLSKVNHRMKDRRIWTLKRLLNRQV